MGRGRILSQRGKNVRSIGKFESITVMEKEVREVFRVDRPLNFYQAAEDGGAAPFSSKESCGNCASGSNAATMPGRHDSVVICRRNRGTVHLAKPLMN